MKILNIFLGNGYGGLEKNAVLYGEMLESSYNVDYLILKNSKLDKRVIENIEQLYLISKTSSI